MLVIGICKERIDTWIQKYGPTKQVCQEAILGDLSIGQSCQSVGHWTRWSAPFTIPWRVMTYQMYLKYRFSTDHCLRWPIMIYVCSRDAISVMLKRFTRIYRVYFWIRISSTLSIFNTLAILGNISILAMMNDWRSNAVCKK